MKKNIYFTFVILFSIIIFYSLYQLNVNYNEENKNKRILKEFIVYNNYSNEDNLINLYKEKLDNNDVVGVLKVGNLFDTVLVQTTDNDYYLNHLPNKQESILGSVFVDYRTKLDAKQINIYGHNSKIYDIPFKKLEKFLDKTAYDNNKYITLTTEKDISTYEIFSVKIVKDDTEHMTVKFNTRLEWQSHFNRLKEESLYETGVLVTLDDEILVLQTCLYNNSKGKLLILNSRKVEKN